MSILGLELPLVICRGVDLSGIPDWAIQTSANWCTGCTFEKAHYINNIYMSSQRFSRRRFNDLDCYKPQKVEVYDYHEKTEEEGQEEETEGTWWL